MLGSFSIYTTVAVEAVRGYAKILSSSMQTLPSFTTMNNIRCALRARSRALRNRPRTLLYTIFYISIYIVVRGEGGISAPYLYIIDKKESDWLLVTAVDCSSSSNRKYDGGGGGGGVYLRLKLISRRAYIILYYCLSVGPIG